MRKSERTERTERSAAPREPCALSRARRWQFGMGFTVDGPTFQEIDTVDKWQKIYGDQASSELLHGALASTSS